MDLTKLAPELKKFVDDEVRNGHFGSPDEVIAAALARLMLDPPVDDLDDSAYAAIEAADAAIDRGEGLPFEDVAARLRRRYRTR